MIPRLPRRVVLGPGYIVQTVILPPKELAIENDEEEEPRHIRSPGSWDVETYTIYISGGLSLEEQWRVWRHELNHALIDIDWIDRQRGK